MIEYPLPVQAESSLGRVAHLPVRSKSRTPYSLAGLASDGTMKSATKRMQPTLAAY